MSFKYLVVDFLLLIGAFFAVNYLKTGTLDLIHPYEKLLVVFLGFWFLVSLLTKKFHPELYVKYWPSVFNLLRANVFIVFCISFFVVITGFTEVYDASYNFVNPDQSNEFQVNYNTGDIIFNEANADQTVFIAYWKKGTYVDASYINAARPVMIHDVSVQKIE